MAIFYTDSGSFNRLEVSGSLIVSGSGSAIISVSGSTGGLLQVSDLTAGANIFQITSASIDIFKIDQSKNVLVSGSLIVTGSITGSLLGTASFATSASFIPVGAASINVSAGTTSNNVSQLIFSNANNLTFGLNSNTVTVSYKMPINSYFEHIPVMQGTSTSGFGASVNIVQAFVLPYDISISYIRAPLSFAYTTTTLGSTANTSGLYNQSNTFYANIYSLGTGANSKSLQQVAQGSVSMLFQISATEGANSNAQTVQYAFSYFTEGVTSATGTFTTTIASSVFNFSSTIFLSNIGATGLRGIDIPFATSLPAGQYWIAFQKSSNTATSGFLSGTISNGLSLSTPFVMVTQSPTINLFGYGTGVSGTAMNQLGLGQYTTNAVTSNSIGLSQLSTIANFPRIPFQFIRLA